ncbi:KTSC domain-containing protein [Lysobacter auxotrophicus]|uniref:KTSC domain-containing protein n=1 Tax=Lysobacter auxotrophicus TaxID=2992573 RepID=UPI0031BBACC0
MGYDAQSKILEIEFESGAVYKYFDVSPDLHAGLINAASKGAYFADHLRWAFDYEMVRSSR